MTDTDSAAGLHPTAEPPMRTAVVLPWRAEGQMRDAAARLAEAVELARSIGLDIVHTATLTLRVPQPATLLGTGQVATLGAAMAAAHVGLVVVDAPLTPV
jgi:GTP-binding protein HflX